MGLSRRTRSHLNPLSLVLLLCTATAADAQVQPEFARRYFARTITLDTFLRYFADSEDPLIRVLEDDNAPANQDQPMLRVVAPSGKVGFVPIDSITPLINDQMCYVKQAGSWKIAGFIGGDQ